MIRNVLTRRREYGTYLATARRHRRRLKMQKREESRSFQPALRPSSAYSLLFTYKYSAGINTFKYHVFAQMGRFQLELVYLYFPLSSHLIY